ncbi:fibroblast growth factor receptor 3-like [Dendronephthya gigantea]|uniref:fibroblast growth factor receptor 3-like n=1 Tax=Dendronephthya gigantea TaxID=151771 RepID=UPI00106BDD23|nr:fibroblast growth factor receptor 3-like [Dendronephthya gigantea]
MDIVFPEHPKDVDSSPKRRLPSIHEHNSKEEKQEEEIMSYICVLDDWEIKKNDLTILNKKLGGGCFGVVKKGLFTKKKNDEELVAVKMLKDEPSAADRSDLLMELFILKEVNRTPHPNVIRLIGAYTIAEPILVLTEFCSRGNLQYLLKNSRVSVTDDNNEDISQYKNVFSTLSHRKLLQIAVDIACGMKHLAANQFVHRDLAARNILISANYEAKVSDFGLARPITGVEQMYIKSNRNLLPVKWMAVESLTRGIFRTSSDVWAYGIVLWEITTLGREPYPDISPFDTFTFVTSGNRMERPPHCSEELYGIMRKCWENDQKDRPSFEEVHEEVKEMLDETDDVRHIFLIKLRFSVFFERN